MTTAAQFAHRAELHAPAIAAITSPLQRAWAVDARHEHAASLGFRKAAMKFPRGSHAWADLIRKALHREALYVTALVRSEELRKEVS